MGLEVGLRLTAPELRQVSRVILEDLGMRTVDLEIDDLLPALRRALLCVYDARVSAAGIVADEMPPGVVMYRIHGEELRAVTAIESSEVPLIVARALTGAIGAIDWELERARA